VVFIDPAAFLIVFREAFEAFLLVSVIYGVLTKTGRESLKKYVNLSVAFSILTGILLGTGIYLIYRGFPQKELFEAGASYLAAVILSTVIIWMARHGSRIKQDVEARLGGVVTPLGVFIVSTIFVFREVLETVLFLTPFMIRSIASTVSSTVAGIALAFILVFAMYRMGMKLDLRKFFMATSILLVFVASGLVGYGTYELVEWAEESGINLGFLAAKAFDLGISEDHILHPDNVLGSILSVLVGYYPYMPWLRVFVQGAFLAFMLAYVIRVYKA